MEEQNSISHFWPASPSFSTEFLFFLLFVNTFSLRIKNYICMCIYIYTRTHIQLILEQHGFEPCRSILTNGFFPPVNIQLAL